jgi:hypothetical protein
MTPGTLPRRLLVGGLSTALLAGAVGALPLLSSASAACAPTYTDPAGDAPLVADGVAVPGVVDLGNDPDLDILDVTHSVDGGTFSSVVHLAKLEDFGPQVTFVDEFVSHFTVNGKAVDITARRTHPVQGDEVDSGTLTVAGTDTTVPVQVVVDLKASTVTAQIAASAFETALGGALAGKPFSAMSAESTQVLNEPDLDTPGLAFPMDTATAPATASYAFGASCSGGVAVPVGPTATTTATPTASATPSPSPTASGPTMTNGLFDQPRKGCVTYKDATADADPTGTGLDNEPALDVTQVNLKSPNGALQVFVGLTDPSAGLFPLWDGPVWSTSFTVNGKKVTLTASDTGPADATVGTAANKDIKATAKLDTKAKNIVFTVPLVGLSKAVGTTVKRGTPITGTAVETAADSLLGPQTADTAAGTKPEEKTYAYGDNRCFVPPPGAILIDAARSGQYGDRTLVFATLNDEDGTPVAGVKLTGILTGGRAVSAKTDSDGIADLLLPLTMPAGTKLLTVSYAGDREVGPTRAATRFAVVPERTVLRLAALRGGALATVVDDDRTAGRSTPHPVVGRYVKIVVGSKTLFRRTSSRGQVVITGVRKGTVVKVTFLPVRNLYYGTRTLAVRAR